MYTKLLLTEINTCNIRNRINGLWNTIRKYFHREFSFKMQLERSSGYSVDVVIVGAGISGLTSAYKLSQRDPSLRICVLESSYFLGGQVTSHGLGEIGAKWYTEDQQHMHILLKSLNLSGTKRVILAPKMKSCYAIDRGICAFLAKFELRRYINELEMKSEQFKPGKYHNTR